MMRGVPMYLPVAEPLTFDGECVYRAAIYRVRPFQRIVSKDEFEPLYASEEEAIRVAARAITQAMEASRDR